MSVNAFAMTQRSDLDMECISCLRGFNWECGHSPTPEPEPVIEIEEETETVGPGRPPKPDEEISVSAGRKRAAVIYTPYMNNLEWCEWRNLANCGGGKRPILGCLAGKPKNIHHGPVKATYRNERTNIHLICPDCHNNWHSANDDIYDEDEFGNLPHSPRPITDEEKFIVATGKRLVDA